MNFKNAASLPMIFGNARRAATEPDARSASPYGFPRSNPRLGLLADVSLGRVARLQRNRLELEALDQRHLGDRKNHRQRYNAECLEADPEVGALGAQDEFVQER